MSCFSCRTHGSFLSDVRNTYLENRDSLSPVARVASPAGDGVRTCMTYVVTRVERRLVGVSVNGGMFNPQTISPQSPLLRRSATFISTGTSQGSHPFNEHILSALVGCFFF